MAHGIPTRLTPAEGRRFAWTLAPAFGGLAALLIWRGHEGLATAMGVIAVLSLLAGLLIPGRLRPVYAAWMKLALALSKVTTPIFMGIVYFLVLTPVGVLVRRLRGDPLKPLRGRGTYWVTRPPATRRRTDLQRQF